MKAGTLPVKNYTTNFYPESDLMTNEYDRGRWPAVEPVLGLPPAPLPHGHLHRRPVPGMTVEEPEYEMYAAWGRWSATPTPPRRWSWRT